MKSKSYLLEFASVFIAVIAAFALNNWNDNRKSNIAEEKMLQEIRNGLLKDKEDIAHNLVGHENGLGACSYWHRFIIGQAVDTDSAALQLFHLTRDFVSIQNRAGYESLKSKGLETIKDDSLRLAIISLYEFDYAVLMKLEEEYEEAQFHKSYFPEFNAVIAPMATFDERGNMQGLVPDARVPAAQANVLRSYLWRIRINRLFVMQFYREVGAHIDRILESIESRS